MPRKIPIPPEVQVTTEERAWRIPLKLVTPMLGGGHVPRHVDEVTPVSAKAIRGHLRFWWRTMCARDLENPGGLHATELMAIRESEVFGGQTLGSPFDISITDVQKLDIDRNYRPSAPEKYALFSIAGTSASVATPGLSFTLNVQWLSKLHFDKRIDEERKRREARRVDVPLFDLKTIREHFNRSLWAWLHFGGLGSRTRRGLGCFEVEGRYSFKDGRTLYAPHPEIYWSKQTHRDDSVAAWHQALTAYSEFRQTPRGAKQEKTVLKLDDDKGLIPERLRELVQGRTKWPEPDSIRNATGCFLAPRTIYLENGAIVEGPTKQQVIFRDHTQPVVENGLPAYPRAMLGLPIIFQFADGPTRASRKAEIPPSERDPDQSALVPIVQNADGTEAPGDRMASPVITKPIRFEDGWHAAIILLDPPQLDFLAAALQQGKNKRILAQVTHDQIVGPAVSSFVPMRGKENALDALGAFIQTKGFTRYEGPR